MPLSHTSGLSIYMVIICHFIGGNQFYMCGCFMAAQVFFLYFFITLSLSFFYHSSSFFFFLSIFYHSSSFLLFYSSSFFLFFLIPAFTCLTIHQSYSSLPCLIRPHYSSFSFTSACRKYNHSHYMSIVTTLVLTIRLS